MAGSGEERALGWSLLLMRVVIGVIMLYYGVQNVFGVMGGEGFYASSESFANAFGVEHYVGQAAMVGQLVAGVLLIAGLATRVAALVIGSMMMVAAVMGAQNTESLVKTTSTDPLAAVGYPTCILVMSIVMIFLGGGLLSIDAKLKTDRRKAKVAKLS